MGNHIQTHNQLGQITRCARWTPRFECRPCPKRYGSQGRNIIFSSKNVVAAAITIASLLLGGCSTYIYKDTYDAASHVQGDSYIYGVFHFAVRQTAAKEAIRFQNLATNEEFLVAMESQKNGQPEKLIKIVPGEYKLLDVVTDAPIGSEKTDILPSYLKSTFEVRPGVVAYVGEFTLESKFMLPLGTPSDRLEHRFRSAVSVDEELQQFFPFVAGLDVISPLDEESGSFVGKY